MDVGKAALSAIVAGVIVGLACMGAGFVGVTALPVFVVVAGGIFVSVLVGMGLDYLDDVTGVSKRARKLGNKVEKSVAQAFNQSVVEPISQTIYQLERHIEWLYLRNCTAPLAR